MNPIYSFVMRFWQGLRPSPTQLKAAGHNWILLVFTGTLLLFEPRASEYLEFNRSLISSDHQFWRLITAHWVHLGLNHWVMNALGLGLVTLIFQQEQHARRDLFVFLLLSTLVSLFIYLLSPSIGRYVGLSGVIHGYFVYYLFIGGRQTPLLCIVAWVGTFAKVFNEQRPHYDGSQTAELIGGMVAYDAHLYGFICGTVIGAGLLCHELLKQRAQTQPRTEKPNANG